MGNPLLRDVPLVLVADDVEIHRSLATTLLQGLGVNTVAVADGHSAVNEGLALQPDLFLLDCRMPGRDGFAATRTLRRLQGTGELRYVPVIGLSAEFDAQAVLRARDAGMDECLPKPLRRALLRHVLFRHGLIRPNRPCAV